MEYIEVDDVDNAKNLLDSVEKYVGKGSVVYSEVTRLLKDGFDAKDIAGELIRLMNEPSKDESSD